MLVPPTASPTPDILFDNLEVADYAHVLERGRIAVEGTQEELGKNERVLAAYLG